MHSKERERDRYSFAIDHQKLEREARICRQLKHSSIGKILGQSPFE